jgi:hypothetical protein
MRQVAAVSLLILAGLALGAAPASAQVISATPTSIDFGNMKQMESRDTAVTVTNNGAGILHIREVDADCGCTIPTLAKNELAPGESTVVEINFNSKKFHGNVVKMVHIYSNDPDQPVVDVMLTANVFSPLIIDPPTQRTGFSQSLQGEELTNLVTFTATEAPQLEIDATKSRKGLFDIKTINNYEGNPQVAVMEVTIPADMPTGRQRDNVRVKTNIEDTPYVDIELACWVVRKLAISHEEVNFRYKSDLRQKIRITPFIKGLEFQVTGAEVDLPELEVSYENTIPNKEALVRLSGKPIGKEDPRAVESKGRIEGKLTIFTDLPDLPSIEVPVSYLVRM